MRVAALLLASLALASPVRAQLSRFLSAGIAAGTANLHTEPVSGPTETLTGMLLSGGGTITFKRLSVEVLYTQGKLSADTGSAISRDLVDGSALLVVRPVSWLAVKAGPHLRAWVTQASTAQFQAFEVRLRGEGALVEGRVRAHVEGFRSVSATVNFGAEVDYVQGGSAGLTFQLPRAPVWGRLNYFIDQVAGVAGGRETLDGVAIAIGIGGR